MEIDHLDPGSRFSRSRPPIRRYLALAAAALLLVAGKPSEPQHPAPPQSEHRTTIGAAGPPNVPQPAASDPVDGESNFKPYLVPCADLRYKKPSRYAVVTPEQARIDLHNRILWDIGDFYNDRMWEKDFVYALTGLAILASAVAAFLIATDFQQHKAVGESIPRPWRKNVVVGFQIGATVLTGAVATFKLTDNWHVRVDGLHQLRNLDSELVVGGCTTDVFSRMFKQVNLIEAVRYYDLVFNPSTNQNASTDQPGEPGEGDNPPASSQGAQSQEESSPGASDDIW